jgi:hypothetical protein
MSSKSYILLPNGREELQDFGIPSQGSSDSSLLWNALKFDAEGKLIEDIDVKRPIFGPESYRCVYTYNQMGLRAERVGYNEDGSSDGRNDYSYDPRKKKTEELVYSADGRLRAR